MDSTSKLLINSTMGCTRIALLEDNNLVDLFIDRPDHKRMVGNIYKGKVQNVLPGMQAAFIDIGYTINAFLPFTEIGDSDQFNNIDFSGDNNKKKSNSKENSKTKETNLEIGDFIIVQVIKEAFSGKGPRVTTNISLPGSLMVLVPNSKYIGISKKIHDRYEKKRLRDLVKTFKPKDCGIIVRTISSGKNDQLLKNDFKRLINLWKEIKYKIETEKQISMIYQDFTTSDLIIRDLLSEKINSLSIDNKKLYNRIFSLIKSINPTETNKIKYYKNKKPIFDNYNIEEQIGKCLKPKVWMKSGAYLIIEHTEAMVVVDVNSGRYIGKATHEQNSLQINLEAAKELVRQFRIRDIGGLVVIDFIDLAEEKNRKKVYNKLKEYLRHDRAKSSVSEFSAFGLLQMTRQRVGLSLLHTLTEVCGYCNGLSRIASKDYTLTNIENWIKRFKSQHSDRRLIIYVHEELKHYIKENKQSSLTKLMFMKLMWIEIKVDSDMPKNQFRVYSKKRKKDVTKEV